MHDEKTKKTYILAEIGTSHGGNLTHAFKLIDAAKEAGADCAKFQIVYAKEILHPLTGYVQLPTGKVRLYDRFKALEVSISFYKKLRTHCQNIGIDFVASPFGLKSAHELRNLNPSYVKIASPELNHIPLLQDCAQYNIPMILSTGVSKLKDIEQAVKITERIQKRVLLHCVTSYPAPEQEYNLNFLPVMRRLFGLAVGVSDHSLDPILVPVLSYVCGGRYIEKHFCISNDGDGLDDPIALNPKDFARMVQEVRLAETLKNTETIHMMNDRYGKEKIDLVLGTGQKRLALSEEKNYARTNRSIHFVRSLKAGTILTEKNLIIVRTEKELKPGLTPEFLPIVLGAHLVKDVESGQGLAWEDIIQK